jgi:hypothetical protein
VKSDLSANKIDFDELIERLKGYIRLKIDSGEYTERSLARVLRVSQPHLHNMLKGVRRMNLEFADQVMAKFQIGIFDLISDEEILDWFDDNNTDWLALAVKRRPAVRSATRDRRQQLPWRTGS